MSKKIIITGSNGYLGSRLTEYFSNFNYEINNLISLHEKKLANPILEYISNRNDLQLIGKNKIIDKDRAPTISFISKNKSSKEVSKILVSNNIATRNDNF